MKRQEKGITLVALIITIIVLLILAVVAIGAVQDDGIIEYAKNARDEYGKAQDNETATIEQLLGQIDSNTGKGIVHNGVIPNDGTYISEGTTLTSGDNFPTTVKDGDIYRFGDYEYCYNKFYSLTNENGWKDDEVKTNGWGVRVIDDQKSEYGEILTTINNINVNNMRQTFANCTNLINSPDIPAYVVRMYMTFFGCENLATAPVIPQGVTNMYGTFSYCSNLVTPPVIPSSVINMRQTFAYSGITKMPNIPEKVENMQNTFSACTALKLDEGEIFEIPASVTRLRNTFAACTLSGQIRIKTISEILESGDDGTEGAEENASYKDCFLSLTGKIKLMGVGETVNENNEKVYLNQKILENLVSTANNNNVEIIPPLPVE